MDLIIKKLIIVILGIYISLILIILMIGINFLVGKVFMIMLISLKVIILMNNYCLNNFQFLLLVILLLLEKT